jgi:hypothetical protein
VNTSTERRKIGSAYFAFKSVLPVHTHCRHITPPEDCAAFLAWVVPFFGGGGILKVNGFKLGVASGVFMHRLTTWQQNLRDRQVSELG